MKWLSQKYYLDINCETLKELKYYSEQQTTTTIFQKGINRMNNQKSPMSIIIECIFGSKHLQNFGKKFQMTFK